MTTKNPKLRFKRPVMLLEVLIAFAIIVLCIFPIIAPHVAVVKAERDFSRVIELDHFVNYFYGELIQRLYLNEIPWSDIEEQKWAEITPPKLPFTGKYQFKILRNKPSKPGPRTIYKIQLTLIFEPHETIKKTSKTLTYEYVIYLERLTPENGS